MHGVPAKVDDKIAKLKLETMGVALDEPTDSQKAYLASWTSGT